MSSVWWTAIAIIAIPVIYSILYAYYKEREWRKNNPDEFAWLDKIEKKDKD
jgi:hypothetical protein